tara:strand:+ start:559 stop:933 length:375 start_codon:yes stop_codon:yes gene_type:complete
MTAETTGSIIDRMLEIRTRCSELNKEVRALGEEKNDLESILLRRLRADDAIQAKSLLASATISEITVPSIEDWDAFEKWVIEENALYMLEKRPSGGAFRELIQQGESVPGLKPIIKTSISLRTA